MSDVKAQICDVRATNVYCRPAAEPVKNPEEPSTTKKEFTIEQPKDKELQELIDKRVR